LIFLKILFFIIILGLILSLLTLFTILFALWVKIQICFEYEEDKKVFWVKYGLIRLKIYPEMFTKKEKKPKKVKKDSKLRNKLRLKVAKTKQKAKDKVKDIATEKVADIKEKKAAKSDLDDAIFIEQEEERIAVEEVRLAEEIPKAEAEYKAAETAEKEGKPWPDVVSREETSKLDEIKEFLNNKDFIGAYDTAKKFMSAFSFDSIIALLSTIGDAAGKSISKVGSRIVIKQLRIGLIISGEDAASTAIKYGRIAAIAYPSLGKLASVMTIDDIALDMIPDYLAIKDRGELRLNVAFRPLMLFTPFMGMIPAFMKGGFNFYKDYKKVKKAKGTTT